MATIGGLFSGVGGLEWGLELAGLGETVWQVEVQPFQRKILKKHWPKAKLYDDVRTVGRGNLAKVDIIAGGFPCTGFSRAGRRQAFCDPQSALWHEMERIIREMKPKAVVIENVIDLYESAEYEHILEALASMDFKTETVLLNGAAFGAPHQRGRLFILGYKPVERRGRVLGLEYPSPRGVPPRPWEPERTLPKMLRYGGLFKGSRLQSVGNAVMPDMSFFVGSVLKELMMGKPMRKIPEVKPLPKNAKYWPTPIASDAKGSRRTTARKEFWTSNDGVTLLDAIWLEDKKDWGRATNPQFTEALMGFPVDYTLPLDAAGGEGEGEAGEEQIPRAARAATRPTRTRAPRRLTERTSDTKAAPAPGVKRGMFVPL